MGLLNDLKEKYKVISIIGMSKNAGKTTTLNYLIEEGMDEGITLGITSTGRDGESTDLVTGTSKPKVYLDRGTIVTVPTSLHNLADAGLEIMKMTDYWTSLGQIMICRVVSSGYVQVAGPVTREEQAKVCDEILAEGVDMVLIDGAIDRKSVAAPDVSDAVIVSTGAVLSRTQKRCIEETSHVVNVYQIPEVEDEELKKKIEDRVDLGKILIIDKENVKVLDLKTCIGAGVYLENEITDETTCVYIPGVFTESVIDGIHPKKFKHVTFVLKDPTKFFIDSASWAIHLKKGIQVRMLKNIEIAAITVNPYAPLGYSFDAKDFQEAMQAAMPEIPVVNVRR